MEIINPIIKVKICFYKNDFLLYLTYHNGEFFDFRITVPKSLMSKVCKAFIEQSDIVHGFDILKKYLVPEFFSAYFIDFDDFILSNPILHFYEYRSTGFIRFDFKLSSGKLSCITRKINRALNKGALNYLKKVGVLC